VIPTQGGATAAPAVQAAAAAQTAAPVAPGVQPQG